MFGQQCLTASNGAVCLDKIHFSEEIPGFVWTKFITLTEVCAYKNKQKIMMGKDKVIRNTANSLSYIPMVTEESAFAHTG